MVERYVAEGSFPRRKPSPTGRIDTDAPNIQNFPVRTPEVTRIRDAIASQEPNQWAGSAVHLHHLWQRGPKELRGITSAMAVCGAVGVPREKVTSFPEDATCAKCKKKVVP